MCDQQEKDPKRGRTANSKSHQIKQLSQSHHHYQQSDDADSHDTGSTAEDSNFSDLQSRIGHDKTHHSSSHHYLHKQNCRHVSISESLSSSSDSSSSSSFYSSSSSSYSSSSSSSSSFSSSSSVSTSSSSLSSENSSEDGCRRKKPQHSQSCTDISGKHRYFEGDDTAPLIDKRGYPNRHAHKQKRKRDNSSLGGTTHGGTAKNNQKTIKGLGNDASFRKVKSMEALTRPKEQEAHGKEDEDEQEKKKSEARKNFMKEKMKFSAFLNEITRQVLSPQRLTTLGVTDAQRPCSPGLSSGKSGTGESSIDKPGQEKSRPTSADSVRSRKCSRTSRHSNQLSQSKSFHHLYSHRSTDSPHHMCHRPKSCTDLSCLKGRHTRAQTSQHRSRSPSYKHNLHHHQEEKSSSHRHREGCNSPIRRHHCRHHHTPVNHPGDVHGPTHHHGDPHYRGHYNSSYHHHHGDHNNSTHNHREHHIAAHQQHHVDPNARHHYHGDHYGHTRQNQHGDHHGYAHHYEAHHSSTHYREGHHTLTHQSGNDAISLHHHHSNLPNPEGTTPHFHVHHSLCNDHGDHHSPSHLHHHRDHHNPKHRHHHGDHTSLQHHSFVYRHHHGDHHSPGPQHHHGEQHSQAHQHNYGDYDFQDYYYYQGDHHNPDCHYHHGEHSSVGHQHHHDNHPTEHQHHRGDHQSSDCQHGHGDHHIKSHQNYHREHHPPDHQHHHKNHHKPIHQHHLGEPNTLVQPGLLHGDHQSQHHSDNHNSEQHEHHHVDHHSESPQHYHGDHQSESAQHHHSDHHSPGHQQHHGDPHRESSQHHHDDHNSPQPQHPHGFPNSESSPHHHSSGKQHHRGEQSESQHHGDHHDISHQQGHCAEPQLNQLRVQNIHNDTDGHSDHQAHVKGHSACSPQSPRKADFPGNSSSPSFQDEEQTSFPSSSLHKEKPCELGTVMILQEQNEGLHQSLLKTAVRMECLGEEFMSSQKHLETELHRTRTELGSITMKLQGIQDNCSSTQQTNNLLEQKLQSVVQTMEGERERLNQRIVALTEQLSAAKFTNSAETLNVTPVLHKTDNHFELDDPINQVVNPITPPPAEFMDSHNYETAKTAAQEQTLGSVPEEEESDWSEMGEETPRFVLTSSKKGQSWRIQEVDVDKDSESGGEEIVRQPSPRPRHMPHLQFTIHNEILPAPQTKAHPSAYMIPKCPNFGSAILVRSASLEEIPLAHHHMQKELRGTEAMMDLHYSGTEGIEDLDNEIIHHWKTSNSRERDTGRASESRTSEVDCSLARLQSTERILNHLLCEHQISEGKGQVRAEVHGWTGGIPDQVLKGERTQL